jgi:hypothetical protein
LIRWSDRGIGTSLCELFYFSNLSYVFDIQIALFRKVNVSEWFRALLYVLYSRLTCPGYHGGYFLNDGRALPSVYGIIYLVLFKLGSGVLSVKSVTLK